MNVFVFSVAVVESRKKAMSFFGALQFCETWKVFNDLQKFSCIMILMDLRLGSARSTPV